MINNNSNSTAALTKVTMGIPLKIGCWNIHGHKSSTLGNKLKLSEIIYEISKFDIYGLVETHSEFESDLELNSFKCYTKHRNRTKNKLHGGIALYIKNNLLNGTKLIRSNSKNIIWCELDKKFFGLQRNIYLGTVYFSPQAYENAKHEDYITELENDVAYLSRKGDIIIQGDFNARTGEAQEFITDDANSAIFHDSLPDDYESDIQIIRQSLDKGNVDKRGTQLIDLCTENNLRILNGRIVGDCKGKKTCFQHGGSSLVDYVITNQNFLKNVRYFKIEDLKPHISDHCQLTYGIKAKLPPYKETVQNCIAQKYKKLNANENAKTQIPRLLSDKYAAKLVDSLDGVDLNDNTNINKAVKEFTNTLQKLSIEAGFRYSNSDSKHKSDNPPWFDKDCQIEKKDLLKIGKTICRNPHNHELKKHLRSKKKKFKKKCKKTKQNYYENKIKQLDFKNPKQTWKQLKTTFNIGKAKKSKDPDVNIDQFHKFFKDQNKSDEQAHFDEKTPCTNDEDDAILNSFISQQEIEQAIGNLKNNKSPGHDNILNELLKSGKEQLLLPLEKLFNTILKSGTYPSEWSMGIIVPIHKKGDTTDVNNYRGITLLPSLGKLFTQILNTRLNMFLDKNDILPKEQAGFRKGHSTIDNIMVLKSLIDKHVKTTAKKRSKLFTCFVDFSKAFDTIPRDKLLEKVSRVGIGGKFLEILQSMYTNDKSAVKLGQYISKQFTCYKGVKQGCMLSPTLFNIYLHDLPLMLNKPQSNLTEINDVSVKGLLYADDLVLIAQTHEGLQYQLN